MMSNASLVTHRSLFRSSTLRNGGAGALLSGPSLSGPSLSGPSLSGPSLSALSLGALSLCGALSLGALLVGCTPDSGPPPALPVRADGSAEQLWWQESFDAMPSWESPSNASQAEIDMVFTIGGDPPKGSNDLGAADAAPAANHFLTARHDARPGTDPRAPAVHYGKTWREAAPPFDQACVLSWKWRVRQHPAVKDDPWLDVGASVYVIVRMPGLFGGGRGFKFGWLSAAGKKGEQQRGLYQIAQRVGPASEQWQSERVDLCSLYRSYYDASPAGEKVLYVGLVTDADNTESLALADYDEFKLSRQ